MSSTYKPTKRQRRLGIRVIPKLDKYISRRPYAPGIHGQRRNQTKSDYGLQLAEKQKVKFIYGLRERQLRRMFSINPQNFIPNLETRLDNVIFRAGFVNTRVHARQLVSHGHFKVNNKKNNSPSYLIKTGDIIEPAKPDKATLNEQEIPAWINVDNKTKKVTIKNKPGRDDITSEINDQLIIEYFSR